MFRSQTRNVNLILHDGVICQERDNGPRSRELTHFYYDTVQSGKTKFLLLIKRFNDKATMMRRSELNFPYWIPVGEWRNDARCQIKNSRMAHSLNWPPSMRWYWRNRFRLLWNVVFYDKRDRLFDRHPADTGSSYLSHSYWFGRRTKYSFCFTIVKMTRVVARETRLFQLFLFHRKIWCIFLLRWNPIRVSLLSCNSSKAKLLMLQITDSPSKPYAIHAGPYNKNDKLLLFIICCLLHVLRQLSDGRLTNMSQI